MSIKTRIMAGIILLAPLYLVPTVKASELIVNQNSVNISPQINKTDKLAVAQWAEFSPPTGQFAISMPGTPTEETEKDKDGFSQHSFKLESEKDFYLVSYLDLPNVDQVTTDDIKVFLDNAPSLFVDGANAKLLQTTTIALGEHPGKEFDFSFENGVMGKGRVYMVRNRLFIIVSMADQKNDTKRFLDSFRLVAK